MPDPDLIHLAVALDGTGWHPAAWREPDARPHDLLTAGHWADLVGTAERGLLDLVTFEDGLALQSDHPWRSDERTDRVRGRLDAVLIASRVAPTTRHIGLIPTAITTHTEPFHLSKAIATLDYVSSGRAGVRVQISASPEAAGHFGRRVIGERSPALTDDLIGEAADYIEVLRRLWDSWEDDAEIRDVRTGRFIDRNKLHYIDFEGTHFSVKGPSITPRPPQGQPIVAALGHVDPVYQLIAGGTDLGFVTPHSTDETAALVDTIAAQRPAGLAPVRVFADLVVFLADTSAAAHARKARLDERLGAEYRSDAEIFVGTAAELADLLQQWHAAGAAGFRLRPATLPHDLTQITDTLVPELRRRGVFRDHYQGSTLRDLLGLSRPANRYAGV
ncbi:LLM class flavin-dependent oxidoreductase [Mycolicibacterium fluoranthenivorans]|uniref:Alkanesulfonate monooxygenase SsuD/methylene tetrahydromethanopterin reductase-like flavin-dependent oxidoreductase (Luciferase family) n=1 Tax=Mycolicibacterium fluoranthenivorans TaxID=258505 RepID=A0A7X5TZS8_9MYCO|nr:LLM class flavin-dependent oxidoreductase [Mycolicibacterium fluoranthenivorans]MCV7358103.1 LLM class flavin-dependent oxidoreductase [Mycolicibacterium fluoranthenivorans]NIH95778.1 alkanesulfonate monooxygenase SsuD/methylene tetrahydromethanopterin reductase-like flavin-dependent oxidoreductase (luciferase family) [Mycolicibacterium fluoranthenivorans]